MPDGGCRYCGMDTLRSTWSEGRCDAARGVEFDGVHVGPHRVLWLLRLPSSLYATVFGAL